MRTILNVMCPEKKEKKEKPVKARVGHSPLERVAVLSLFLHRTQ